MAWTPKTARPDTDGWQPKTALPDGSSSPESAKTSFLGDMLSNAKHGASDVKDVLSGNYEDIGNTSPTPKTEALADKLFSGIEDPSLTGMIKSAVKNYHSTNPSDYSAALLEKFGETPEGKIVGAIGGLNPIYNAVGTEVSRNINPQITKATGVAPENLELMELAAGAKKGKSLSKIDPSDALLKSAAPKIADAAKSGVTNIAEGAGTINTGYNARSAEALEQGIKAMEADASKHFESMNGIGVSPEIAVKVFDHIDDAVRKNREIDPDLHKDYVNVIERMKEKAKSGMTLQQIHNQRKLLRDVETKNYLTNKPVADVARQAIDAMDEALETAKQKGGSAAGAKGVQGMQSGIAKWAEARKFETIANIINKAQGDPNKTKTAFKLLLNNKKQMRGFTKEERALIKQASENTNAEALMSMAGKFGIGLNKGVAGNTLPWLPFVTAFYEHGSSPYMAAATGLGTGAKYGQKLMARGKAEKVLQAIENRNKVNNDVNPMQNSLAIPFDDFLSNQ